MLSSVICKPKNGERGQRTTIKNVRVFRDCEAAATTIVLRTRFPALPCIAGSMVSLLGRSVGRWMDWIDRASVLSGVHSGEKLFSIHLSLSLSVEMEKEKDGDGHVWLTVKCN